MTAKDDRDFLLLAVGKVQSISANASALPRMPAGGMKKMQLLTFSSHSNALHLLRIILEIQVSTGELDNPADIELYSGEPLPAHRKPTQGIRGDEIQLVPGFIQSRVVMLREIDQLGGRIGRARGDGWRSVRDGQFLDRRYRHPQRLDRAVGGLFRRSHPIQLQRSQLFPDLVQVPHPERGRAA